MGDRHKIFESIRRMGEKEESKRERIRDCRSVRRRR
jgi:hypothetical protein